MKERSQRILEEALVMSQVNDEYIVTRRSFSAIRERLTVLQKTTPSLIFRTRREGNLVFIWRS